MRLAKDLVAAPAAPRVLAILGEGESYGCAIIRRVRDLSGGRIEWTDGTLYPVLQRLEAQVPVTSPWPPTDARVRQEPLLCRALEISPAR